MLRLELLLTLVFSEALAETLGSIWELDWSRALRGSYIR